MTVQFTASPRNTAKQVPCHALDSDEVFAGLTPHAARLLARHGEAPPQILGQEHERNCDQIIMCRHGDVPLLEQVFLGSVTKQVLAQSRADVLVAAEE